MKIRTSASACFGLAGLLTNCGGSPSPTNAATTSFPSTPLSLVTSDAKKLDVEVHTAPYQPLVAGEDSVELLVTDTQTGKPVDGLTVTMTPWMPAMGHGASVTPLLTALGGGKYVFTNVSLFMPGEWQLRIAFSGEVEDSVEPTFNVD
jgi:hypothetical protein